jgi:hypothetical protein
MPISTNYPTNSVAGFSCSAFGAFYFSYYLALLPTLGGQHRPESRKRVTLIKSGQEDRNAGKIFQGYVKGDRNCH